MTESEKRVWSSVDGCWSTGGICHGGMTCNVRRTVRTTSRWVPRYIPILS